MVRTASILALVTAALLASCAPERPTVHATTAPTPTATATDAPATASALATPSATGTVTPVGTASAPPARDIVGARIVISRLGIDLPLAWGDVGRDVPRDGFAGATPEHVALVFPGSALPGTGGNTYIYSHARIGMFITLWSVRQGDEVLLRWPDAMLRYQITAVVGRVPASDTTWLDPRGPERLTLQTSTGPSPADPRFIAIAAPTEAQG